MYLGIDLGTTYSVGAYVKDDGQVEIVDNAEGSSRTPSVVMFDEDDGIIVGEVAKDNAVLRPYDVVSVIKNRMGDRTYRKTFQGIDYTPEMISSFIIRKIVQDAERSMGQQVEGVVVTVPAYFTDAQRKATEDAVTIADVPLLGMINEPTAAALSYIQGRNVLDKNLLVYDLGGGTFDVTVLNIDDVGKIRVRATGGLSNTGGRFFDESILEYVVQYFREKYDVDLEDEEYSDELQELFIKAENAKIQLSQKTKAVIPMRVGKIKESISVTREQFNEMIRPVYLRTENRVKATLEEAGLTFEDIETVLMVGGSSRIPFVEEGICKFLGKETSHEVNPDEAVATGAAIYAKMKADGNDVEKFSDVCSHSIGVVVLNKDTHQQENEIIIRRNSTLPISNAQHFRTVVPNQEVLSLTITEGEFTELTDVTIIGEFEIKLPKGVPNGGLIVINISLNQYQIIHIEVELPEQNFRQEYSLKRNANMDEETIKNVTGMLRDIAVN